MTGFDSYINSWEMALLLENNQQQNGYNIIQNNIYQKERYVFFRKLVKGVKTLTKTDYACVI